MSNFMSYTSFFNFWHLQVLLFNLKKGSVDSDVTMWLQELDEVTEFLKNSTYEKHWILWELATLRVILWSSSWTRNRSETLYSRLPFQCCFPIPWCLSCCKRSRLCGFWVFYDAWGFCNLYGKRFFFLTWWNLRICDPEALNCSLIYVWGWSLVETLHIGARFAWTHFGDAGVVQLLDLSLCDCTGFAF